METVEHSHGVGLRGELADFSCSNPPEGGKVRTRELYEGLLGNHLYPAFGSLGLVDIDDAAVRS